MSRARRVRMLRRSGHTWKAIAARYGVKSPNVPAGPVPEFITRPAPALPSAWAGLSRPLPPEPMTTTTARRVDWSAPHWEAVAAEQIAVDRTIVRAAGAVRVARAPHGGRARLRDLETGGLLRSTGDVAAFGPYQVSPPVLR